MQDTYGDPVTVELNGPRNYRVRGVSLIKFTYFYSCLVFFDFDILSLIKEKKIFWF